MANSLIFNSSIKPILTFQLRNDEKKGFDYFDYSLLRYPELYSLIKALCNSTNNGIEDALYSLPDSLRKDLQFYQITQLKDAKHPALSDKASCLLTVIPRFSDQHSRREMIKIDEHTSAVNYIIEQLNEVDSASHEPDDLQLLIDKGLLVNTEAPPKTTFPPESAIAPSLQFPTLEDIVNVTDSLLIQNSAEPLPPPQILKMLGKHLPELPDNKAILWGCHAGSRMPLYKVLVTSDVKKVEEFQESAKNKKPYQAEKKRWRGKLAAAKIRYRNNDYIHLTEVIPAESRPMLRQHIRHLVANNYFGKLGDGQVESRMSIHNEPATGIHHYRLSKIVSHIVGTKVVPSYAYLSLYLGGANLPRHIDRDQCQFNCSVVFDMFDENGTDVEPWPIYLQIKKKAFPVSMAIGDSVIYRGNKLEHWRDPLPDGQYAAVCFYHFVAQNWKGSLV